MWYTVFIALHATTATVSLLAGLVAMPAGRFFEVYRWAMVAMAAFLAPAIALGWPTYDAAGRVLFPALLVLAAVMIYRTALAGRILPATTGGPTASYLDHIGFTVISLADGFAIVALLRAGAPGWLVALVGVGVPVAGHFGILAARRRLVRVPAAAAWPTPT